MELKINIPINGYSHSQSKNKKDHKECPPIKWWFPPFHGCIVSLSLLVLDIHKLYIFTTFSFIYKKCSIKQVIRFCRLCILKFLFWKCYNYYKFYTALMSKFGMILYELRLPISLYISFITFFLFFIVLGF